MSLNLDVSKLTQSAAMKATPHDNCIVLDLGTGAFPRDIEVRLPDDDGARQNALWDGSLNLAVNDEVLCFEYSGISAWRVMGVGGNDSGAGKARVSEVWESDFGDPALQSDADGNIGIGTAGPDAKLDVSATAGAQLRLTFEDEVKFANFTLDTNHDLTIKPSSTGQVKIQPTTDSIDFFQILDADGGIPVFNVDSTNERVGIGTAGPSAALEVFSTTQNQLRIAFGATKYAEFSFDTSHLLTIDTTSVGHILLNATVRIVDEILHEGDFDTKIGFTDDDVEITVGGLSMLKLTEAGQDLITLGPGSGDVDIDFNGDMFLRGSDGFLGIKTAAPTVPLDISAAGTVAIFGNGASSVGLNFDGAAGSVRDMVFLSGGSARWIFRVNSTAESGGDAGSDFVIQSRTDAGGLKADVFLLQRSSGFIGLSVALPSTRLDIGAGAMEFDEMTGPGAGAVNTCRLYVEDNGAGKTRLMAIFNTGAAQQIAIEP